MPETAGKFPSSNCSEARDPIFACVCIPRDSGIYYVLMTGKNFHEVIQLIHQEDSRYEPGAYLFLRHALDHTLKAVCEQEKAKQPRHISGQELCHGIRDYALQQFGPMALTLLHHWGLQRTEDFGQMVFNLVEYGIFGKTETDSLEDFRTVYDFEEAFAAPFRPSAAFLQAHLPSLSQPS